MIHRLQQILARVNWRLLVIAGVGLLLLSACGKNPNMPPQGSSYTDCWPCAVYEATFNAIDEALSAIIETSCSGAKVLMGIGLLFWLMFHAMTVMTLQEANVRKFVLPVAAILFKAMIITVLISDADRYIDFIGEYLVQPILIFFADISKLILDSNDVVKDATQAAAVASRMAPDHSKLFGEAEGRFLDIVYRIYIALHAGISLGFAIWSDPGLVTFILGLFVMGMFWVLLLTMPLSLMDAFARMGAVMILSPFCLVGWIFPPTKDYLKKLWGVFFGAGMTVFFICVYLALSIYVIMMFVNKHYPGILESATQATDPALVDNAQTLSTSIIGFFVLILAMNKLGAHVPKIANSFGAETVASSWIKAFNGVKKLAIAAAKTAVAVAIASPAVAESARKDVQDVAKSAMKEMK